MKWRSNSVEPTKSSRSSQRAQSPDSGSWTSSVSPACGLEHRGVAQREHLAGRAVGDAEDLLGDLGRVRGGQPRADHAGGDRVDLRRLGVGRRGAAVAGLVVDPAAQPVHAVAGERLDRRARRQLERHGARAVVEAAREVLEHLGLEPLVVALGELPAQRRVVGVHARAARLRGVDVDLDQQAAERLLEAEVERVADRGRARERELVGARRLGDAVGEADALDLAAALQHVRRRHRGGDVEALVDLEDDRLLGRGARGADLGRRPGSSAARWRPRAAGSAGWSAPRSGRRGGCRAARAARRAACPARG